jgi:hypothetical protein
MAHATARLGLLLFLFVLAGTVFGGRLKTPALASSAERPAQGVSIGMRDE